jgi:hypothetical protein
VVDSGQTKVLFKALGFPEDTTSVPFYVLVDEQGQILSASPQLGGANLAATIARVLDEPSHL